MFENLVFHGRIYVIFISAFLPVSEDLDVLLFLDPAANRISTHPTDCIYLIDCARRDSL